MREILTKLGHTDRESLASEYLEEKQVNKLAKQGIKPASSSFNNNKSCCCCGSSSSYRGHKGKGRKPPQTDKNVDRSPSV